MSGRLISQPQMNDLRSRAQRHTLIKKLLEEFGSNSLDVYVLSAQELTRLWLELNAAHPDRERLFEELVGTLPNAVVDYTSPVLDSMVLIRLGTEMSRSGNVLGSYRIVRREGKSLIIFSGHPGLRRYLTAPVYGINHPKVLTMGVGQSAANIMLRTGLVLTLVISPVVRTIEWLFTDEKAALELVLARVSTDIMKGIIATGAGYAGSALAAALSGVSIVAVVPIAAGIGAAIIVTLGLNYFDQKFHLTERLAKNLAETKEEWALSTGQIRRDLSYYLFTAEGSLEFIRRFPGNQSWKNLPGFGF